MVTNSHSSFQSTTQFYGHMGGAVRAVGALLRAAQVLGPWCAVPLAQRIFLTPLPLKWMQKRRAWGPRWRNETVAFERASITLYRPTETPTLAHVVLLVHGWGGSAAQMIPIANALVAHGISPILLELPAHGKNRGSTTALPQFARAVEFAISKLMAEGVSIQALVGHSAGAAACAAVVAHSALGPKLVMIAAPENMQQYTVWFAQMFGVHESTRAAMQARIEAQQGARMQQFSFDALAPRLRSPTLLVHDVTDPLHPSSSAHAFSEKISDGHFFETKGLGHTKILCDQKVSERIAAFLR